MGRQEKGEGMPKLYRKRFIPDEIVELKDDRIVYHEGNIMITEWDVLHPKAKFSHGISCYYMDKGWKISKFLNKKKELVYYYCDIIETAYLKAENAYIFTDLLADVIIHPDGAVEVVIWVSFLMRWRTAALPREKSSWHCEIWTPFCK